MKSRTSCFDTATFKKDLTRFVPLWALYTIAMLLIMLSTVSTSSYWYHPVAALNTSLRPLTFSNLLYGALVAQLLFGDLFQSRLCNALHAMPMTRTARFGSHVCAGMLFALIPDLVVALLMMPFLGTFWYTALLWLGVMLLQYLFFFGIGVLSVMCTGSRFAMAVVYAIINFFAAIVYWFVQIIYLPMMPGVLIDDSLLLQFCPAYHLIARGDYFQINYETLSSTFGRGYAYEEFGGLGSSWSYPAVCAVIGVAALIVALLLYRCRKLECAGDFIAVNWLKPVFLVLYTLCAGAFVAIFGNLFSTGSGMFLTVGLIIGFFTGRMLLERTIRVFRGKYFLQLGILTVVLLLSVWAVSVDLFGIVKYVPDQDDVEYITCDYPKGYDIKLTAPEDIRTVCQIHRLAADNYCDCFCGQSHSYIDIEYHMKDGRTVMRQYYLCADSEAFDLLSFLPKKN